MDTKKLRQKILDLAIHGKLVPQDPNDEPASVLLDRIRAEKEQLIKEGKIKPGKKTSSATPHYPNGPFKIPDSWEWARLGEISNYGQCENFDVEKIDDDSWILELEDIEKDSGKIIRKFKKRERDIKGVRHPFKKGQLLYSKLRTYLNKVLIADEDGYCTTEIIPFDIRNGIFTQYLCSVLRSAYFLDYTQMCGYGVKMPRLSTADAIKGFIPIPPLAEQRRIVLAIRQWDSFIYTLEKEKLELNNILKTAKSKILNLAVRGKLVPQDPADEPAIELLKRNDPNFTPCDNGQYEKIPKSWEWVKLGDVCQIARGSSPRPIKNYLTIDKAGINWIKIGDASPNDKYICSTKEKIRPEGATKSRFVHKGDFLLTNSMSFGKPYILGVDGCIHDGWLVISPKENVYNKDFLYYMLSSEYARHQFIFKASGGVVANLNSDKVADSVFMLPPCEEQRRIITEIEHWYSYINFIQKSLEA